jgi:6-phosphogluconolactonase
MKPFELRSFASAEELARAAVAAWVEEIAAANRAGRDHSVALSGGRIARALFSLTAAEAKARALSVQGVHFFWADERCVPPDDAESNYGLARELLFEPLGVPEPQIHRIRGEDPPIMAAARAEQDIRRSVRCNPAGIPVLDLVLLGMGEDGHVASLFPGEPQGAKSSEGVYRAVTDSPKPPPNRVTLDFPAIAAAQRVWVLVSGAGKERPLRESLEPDGQTPLARVLNLRAHTRILTDLTIG